MAKTVPVALDYAGSRPAQCGGALGTAAVCVAVSAFPVGAVISASLEDVRALPRDADASVGFTVFALMGVVGFPLGVAAFVRTDKYTHRLDRWSAAAGTGFGLVDCGLAAFLLLIRAV